MSKTLEELKAKIREKEAELRSLRNQKLKTAGYSKNRTFRYAKVKDKKYFSSGKSHNLIRSNWLGVEKASIFKRGRK